MVYVKNNNSNNKKKAWENTFDLFFSIIYQIMIYLGLNRIWNFAIEKKMQEF